MARDLQGKVVIITGSANGIGLAIAEKLLQTDIKLAIMLDINEEKGIDESKTLASKYGENRVVFYKCNVVTDLEESFDKIIARHKNIDVLINNAGLLDEKNFRRMLEVSLLSMMDWTMKFYDYMRIDRGGKGGTIINMSSLYGCKVTQHTPFYHAAKFGILGFSRSLGHEANFKNTGIRVIALCPGFTYTNLTANPNVRDAELLEDLIKDLEKVEWQHPDVVGKETIEIFKIADSGTAWLIVGSRPAELLNFEVQ